MTAPSRRDLWGQGLLGFHRAVKDLGIQGQVFQPDPNNWGKTFTSVVRQKFDLIFPGVPTTDRDYALLLRLMDKFAATKFVVAGPYKYLPSKPPNVQGTEFKNQEAGYLAGYLAGLMEKRNPGKDVIGAVGGEQGRARRPVHRGVSGRREESRSAHLDPERLLAKLRGPGEVQGRRRSGRSARARVSSSTLPASAVWERCRRQRRRACGRSASTSTSPSTGPHVLTSAIQRGDVWVYETVRALVRGKLRTGRTTSGTSATAVSASARSAQACHSRSLAKLSGSAHRSSPERSHVPGALN